MLPKSIRWRIQAWHGFLLTALVLGLIVAFYTLERRIRLREVDTQLVASVMKLLPQVTPPPGLPRAPRFGERGQHRRPPADFDQNETNDPPMRDDMRQGDDRPLPGPRDDGAEFETGPSYYLVWTREREIELQSPHAPNDIPYPAEDKEVRTRGNYREILHRVPNGYVVVVGTSLDALAHQMHMLAFWLGLAGVGVVVVGLVGGWWVAGRALRPITDISATAEQISGGDLSQRIDIAETEGELGKLAAVLNETFDRLEESFERQLRFTADASHELRTPISVILTQIQLALSRERSPEEYKKTLATCERAAERLRTLVNQLLELARIDTGDQTLMLESCDLSRVLRESIEFIEPLAEKKHVKLVQNLEAVKLKGDVMKLGQVFINLLNNAIVHNEEGIEITVSLEKRQSVAIIRIADNGVGIPKDALPQLFDRFYRVDKARSRGKGSSGLGLAICKSIVEGHHGTIRAESEPGKGAQFIIELPTTTSARTGSGTLLDLRTKVERTLPLL